MESIVFIGSGILSLRMLIQLADLLYDERKFLPMLAPAARSIVCLTSDASEKSDSSERLSQMAGSESEGWNTRAGDWPLGLGIDTGATGGSLGRSPAGSKQPPGGCSTAQVEVTQDMVLWKDAVLSLLLVSSTPGSCHGTG